MGKQRNGSDEKEVRKARRITGELLWLCQRSYGEISPVISCMASTVTIVTKEWFALAEWVIGYIKGREAQNVRLVYTRKKKGEPLFPRLEVLSDASYNMSLDCRSMIGWVAFLGGELIAWQTSLTKIVTLSSTEAEVHGASSAARTCLYFIQLLASFGINVVPAMMGIDNRGAYHVLNGAQTARMRHIEARTLHLRDLTTSGVIS